MRSNGPASFDPCDVGEALEGFDFDGLGNGPTLYRAADHQCFKDVLVMKGKEDPANEYRHSGDRRGHPARPGRVSRRITRCSPAANSGACNPGA